MKTIDEQVEELRARHRAIARYRVYLFEPLKPKKMRTTEMERGLTYDDAKQKAEKLNAALKAAGEDRFMSPMYGIELVNAWDTLSDAAKERHLALGKSEKDFRL